MRDISLEEVKENICDDYCKFLDEAYSRYDDPDEAQRWLLEHYCADCPLNKI